MAIAVILNYNDAENCIKVARKVLSCRYVDKVVIVDNCSPDESYFFLKAQESEKILILQSDRNGGFACGHNIGIRFAMKHYNPDVLITINSDVIIENKVLNVLVEFIKEHNEYGLVSCAIREKDGNLSRLSYWTFPSYLSLCLQCFWLYRKLQTKLKRSLKNNNEKSVLDVDTIRGSLMCFNGKALEKVKGFDEHTFLYFEENIIGKKLKAAGYKVAFLPQVEYFHNHKQSTGVRYIDIRPCLESAYYYAITYGDVKGIKKAILKACTWFGIKEQDVITGLKRKMRK